MDKPTGSTRISSDAELEAFVAGLHSADAALYAHLTDEMEKLGEAELEAICRTLWNDVAPQDQRTGPPPEAVVHQPDLATLRSPYALWAFAVRQEEQHFNTLTSANVTLNNAQLRSKLASEARVSLDRAANYRAQRRLAFHAARLSKKFAMFPDIRRIDLVEDLARVSQAVERHFLRLLLSLKGKEANVEPVISMTEKVIASLEPIAGAAAVSKRLTNPLKRLEASGEPNLPGGTDPARAFAQVALEGGRIFDYYDRIFQVAQDNEVVDLAQQLSSDMLDRLHRLLGAKKQP